MNSNPHNSFFKCTLITFGLGIASIIFLWGMLTFVNSALPVDEVEQEDLLTQYINNASAERPVSYQNITILDKEYKQRSFRSDVYNVVFRTDDGNITKTNDMELYYDVEKGKQYNVSWAYGVDEVIGEI